METKQTIAINAFCGRQIEVVKTSKFGGFTGNADELLDIINKVLATRPKLEKPIEVVRFYTSELGFELNHNFVCTHDVVGKNERVKEVFEQRRSGEQPVVVREVHRAQRPVAHTVDLILYSRETLEKEGEKVSGADYELVSINTMPTEIPLEVEETMAPSTLWRNYLSHIAGCPAGIGGTFRDKWADEAVFRAELEASEKYWADKVRVLID